jgi:hypothetical protein
MHRVDDDSPEVKLEELVELAEVVCEMFDMHEGTPGTRVTSSLFGPVYGLLSEGPTEALENLYEFCLRHREEE